MVTARMSDGETTGLVRDFPDVDRSAEAYAEYYVDDNGYDGVTYLMPAEDEISHPNVSGFIRNANIMMVVPMRERGPVIRPMLDVVARLMSPERIVVVNDGSDEEAIATARAYGV